MVGVFPFLANLTLYALVKVNLILYSLVKVNLRLYPLVKVQWVSRQEWYGGEVQDMPPQNVAVRD